MSPWNRVHLPGGGSGPQEVTDERLIYELPQFAPGAVSADAVAMIAAEAPGATVDTAAAGVLLAANEVPAAAVDASLSSLTVISLNNPPVPVDDYSAIVTLGNEGPPLAIDLDSLISSIVEQAPTQALTETIVATALDSTVATLAAALDALAMLARDTAPGSSELGTIVANISAGANAASGGSNPTNATGQPDGVRSTTDGGLFGSTQTLTLTYQDFNLGDLVLSNPRVRVVGEVFSNIGGGSQMVIDYSLNNGSSFTNLATIAASEAQTISVDNTYNLPITTDAHLDGFQMRFGLTGGSLGSAGVDAAILLGTATKDY